MTTDWRVLVSYPRSGRTWLWYATCVAIAHETDSQLELMDGQTVVFNKEKLFSDLQLPYATSTHETVSQNSPVIHDRKPRDIMMLTRHPFDILLSTYWWRNSGDTLLQHIKREAPRLASWTYGWYIDSRTVNWITYEDMSEDLPAVIRCVCDWIGVTITDKSLEVAAKLSKFQSMHREDPKKCRMGKVGGWKGVFCTEHSVTAAKLLEDYRYPLRYVH